MLSRLNIRSLTKIVPIVLVFALVATSSLIAQNIPPTPPKIDSVLILKKAHLLELISGGKVVRTYNVALGRGGLAPKQREGDERTPEGHYIIDSRNAHSHYYKALHISYPDENDRKRAAAKGVAPGGAIMIHGITNGLGWIGSFHRIYDWTAGCIAITDSEMDEIWKLVPNDTPVDIKP